MSNAKFAALFLGLVGAFVVVCCDNNDAKYSDKYDGVDVDAILANPRQRNRYYKCFADEAPCATEDARFFRDNLFEAISTNCQKCTTAQKNNLDKISLYYSTKEPKKYEKIVSQSIIRARSH